MSDSATEQTPDPDPSAPPTATATATRSRLSQEDVPNYSLEQALKVPQALADNYAYSPTRPLNIASALGVSPTAGPFRMLTGAAVAYGLTTGAARAPEIGLTPIGMRIVRPTVEGDDVAARREALLRPRVIGEFLRDYDGAALPPDSIAKNVLAQKGVPVDRLDAVLQLILDGAASVGFIREWGGKRFVDLTANGVATTTMSDPQSGPTEPAASDDHKDTPAPQIGATGTAASRPAVSVSSGVNVNIEIHIAADATSETIEDIFKNMRRYVLNAGTDADDGR